MSPWLVIVRRQVSAALTRLIDRLEVYFWRELLEWRSPSGWPFFSEGFLIAALAAEPTREQSTRPAGRRARHQ